MTDKKIKICHIVDSLPIGGLEKTLKAIVLNLKNYQHQIWCLGEKGILAQDFEKEGIPVRAFNFCGGLKITYLLELVRALRKENFKIIHAHDMYPAIWAEVAQVFTRIPVVLVHYQNIYWNISLKDKLKLKFLSYFATENIAVSDATKKSLVKYIKINPKKIRIIYNSAPDLKITVAPSLRLKLRRELGIGEDDFVVGSMGRLKEHKGYSYLLEAMAKILCRLKEQNINCKCVIVGDGAARKDLEFKAKSLGLADIVIFTGWRKDIENLLLTMDIFIQPSTIWEGLPLALAEAASCGLTLIATDIGGNCEIVKEGVNGFIVPPRNSDALAEKIQYLIKEPLELKKMSENSRRIWQEKFTLDEMVKKIGDLYAQYI